MAQVSKKTIKIKGQLLDLSVPRVMGILNITPDSFYSDSRMASLDEVMDRAEGMQNDGATFIDIGGYSTRPGAREISVSEEAERVLPVIEALNKNFPDLIISIDTFRSEVARQSVLSGAHIINDVAGGILDDNMFDTVAELGVPYILMHMRGTPQTMSKLTDYDFLIPRILKELGEKLINLRQKGVSDIIIDPGFGFAKTTAQNFELMKNLTEFHKLGCPLLVGISRKGMIYNTLNVSAKEALTGTTVLNTISLQQGASIIRVHDVQPAVEAVKLWMATSGVNEKIVI
ncbi:dihydropteroate synthase [Dyadobacter frigoris]|uniref:dihydropteroate synthase n=1 Tax=Dyadobacter frigoris TaxID=2576211 RepID=A0A4U6D1Z5_9BACT|nr:dihydropteroate synthase [Dyadobacter frigoris]TKT90177.1 dihydropteroate synthase [Dyadobacter frigoris]GLU52408.1 dihydropteroate synthase [Dyadobacter frigoris]